MADGAKGYVTPIASVFPVEETYKAAQRVEDAISERKKELDRLRQFVSDNTALINLIQKLPDELSHEIMVPFGRAAFFPGRLIHTNELLVLLGDGYYAERTAKHTIEILQRRGKALEAQTDSLEAMISDLQTEASFFSSTAADAAEGLVEIREEYNEEPCDAQESESVPNPSKRKKSAEMSQVGNLNQVEFGALVNFRPLEAKSVRSGTNHAKEVDEDEEYARIMARLDELEKEEQAAVENDEDEENDRSFVSSLQNMKAKVAVEDEKEKLVESNIPEKHLLHRVPELSGYPRKKIMEEIPTVSTLNIEDSDDKIQLHPSNFLQSRNVIGSIVEHSQTIPSDTTTTESPSSLARAQTSKPVSRFKMQRGNG